MLRIKKNKKIELKKTPQIVGKYKVFLKCDIFGRSDGGRKKSEKNENMATFFYWSLQWRINN